MYIGISLIHVVEDSGLGGHALDSSSLGGCQCYGGVGHLGAGGSINKQQIDY